MTSVREAADTAGVDIVAVAKKHAPHVVYLRLVELEAALVAAAERADTAEEERDLIQRAYDDLVEETP